MKIHIPCGGDCELREFHCSAQRRVVRLSAQAPILIYLLTCEKGLGFPSFVPAAFQPVAARIPPLILAFSIVSLCEYVPFQAGLLQNRYSKIP